MTPSVPSVGSDFDRSELRWSRDLRGPSSDSTASSSRPCRPAFTRSTAAGSFGAGGEELAQQRAGQPKATQEEIISINTDARHIALQVALLIPILAGLLGLLNSFRMVRIPEPKPSSSLEGMALG